MNFTLNAIGTDVKVSALWSMKYLLNNVPIWSNKQTLDATFMDEYAYIAYIHSYCRWCDIHTNGIFNTWLSHVNQITCDEKESKKRWKRVKQERKMMEVNGWLMAWSEFQFNILWLQIDWEFYRWCKCVHTRANNFFFFFIDNDKYSWFFTNFLFHLLFSIFFCLNLPQFEEKKKKIILQLHKVLPVQSLIQNEYWTNIESVFDESDIFTCQSIVSKVIELSKSFWSIKFSGCLDGKSIGKNV